MSEPQVSIGGRFGIVAAWYDFWVGLYWNGAKRRLYILPIPCFGFYVDFPRREELSPLRQMEPYAFCGDPEDMTETEKVMKGAAMLIDPLIKKITEERDQAIQQLAELRSAQMVLPDDLEVLRRDAELESCRFDNYWQKCCLALIDRIVILGQDQK